jgi:hypothetical protein
VTGFTSAQASPTNATTLTYALTFAESVTGVAAGDFSRGFDGVELVDAGEIADANFEGSDQSHMEGGSDVAGDEISAAADDHGVAGLCESKDGLGDFRDAGVNARMQAESLPEEIGQMPNAVFGK